jgi:hypothetical protein
LFEEGYMDSIQLEELIHDNGLRHVNFFNGRLLSGEDLSAERDATHAHARHLGQAIGAGVACGLEVSRAQSSPPLDVEVTIKAGLAVNKNGRALRLACDQTISLVRPVDPAKKADCVFSDCGMFAAGSTLTADGFYVLTIAPASQREGLAPVSGLGNTPAACNSRYFTEGVQFRLLPLTVSKFEVDTHARNEVAYQCFGRPTADVLRFLDEAFAIADAIDYGTDKLVLPAGRLTANDVPLAILEWQRDSGLGFIDEWAVRRPVTSPAAAGTWNYFVAERRVSEAVAMLLQFQKHLADVPPVSASWASVKARDHFTWLPAAGILPVGGKQFDPVTFFDGIPLDNTTTEFAFLRLLVRQSLFVEPFDLVSSPPDAIRIFSFEETKDFVLFMRGEPIQPAPAPTPPATPTTPTKGKGQFVIGIRLKDMKESAGAERATVQVQASKTGEEYDAKLVSRDEKLFGEFKKWGSEVAAVFATDKIPSGDYFVSVRLKGFQPWKERHTLQKGELHRVFVELRPQKKEPSGPHVPEGGYVSFNGRVYEEPKLVPNAIPLEEINKLLKDPGYIDPVPEMKEDIRGQLQEVLDKDPGLPVTTEGFRIVMDRAYTGDAVRDEPYAYVETNGGAAVPLLLVPADQSLPLEVSTSRSAIPEFAAGALQSKLAAAGYDDLAVAANLYGNLMAETIDVEVSAARTLISDLKLATTRVRENQTYYPGLSEANAKALRDEKLDDVGLANASTSDVARVLTGLDAESALRYAGRLKDYARSFVPESAWSLEKSGLGLNDNQIATLHDEGIDSIELLKNAPRGRLSAKLGLNAALVDDLQKSAELNLGAGRVALKAEPPLTSIGRVNTEFAAKLSAEGIDSATKLANADPKVVAATLGIGENDALDIVKTATATVLSNRTGLSMNEANRVVRGASAPTLNATIEHAVTSVESAGRASLGGVPLSNFRALRAFVNR